MSLAMQVKIEPSFGEPEEYRLNEVSIADGRRVFRVKHKGGGPSLEGLYGEVVETSWMIEGAQAEEFLRRLEVLSVVVCPEFSMGLDGTTVTMRIECGFSHIEFRWWVDLPEQWGELRGFLAFLYTSGFGEGGPNEG